jgi:hypothetical protein
MQVGFQLIRIQDNDEADTAITIVDEPNEVWTAYELFARALWIQKTTAILKHDWNRFMKEKYLSKWLLMILTQVMKF